ESRLNQALIFLIAQQVEIYFDPALYSVALLRGLFLSIIALFDPVFYHDHYISYGLAGPVSSVFLVFGLIVVLRNLRRLAFLAVVVWFASGLLFLGVLASIPPRPTHLVAIIPVMALISAIGLVSFIEAMLSPNLFHDSATGAPGILLAGILTVVTISGWFQYFFVMPHTFAPSMSDYASWMGRQIPTGANLIFVDIAPIEFVSRNEEDLRLSNHHISTVTRAALEQDPGQTQGWGDFVAFIGPGDSEKFALWLSGQIPDSATQPAYGPQRNLRGYVVTNLSVNGLMDYSLAHSLQSLWHSPAQRLILASFICAICLTLVGRVKNHQASQSES
ncbi:MAG TPA: hypothetical protein VJ180_03975, partial [Pyrinomonadaceae bacterium]|nr:hypothetical protein [Pyrinomonadaceae bacterium]